MRKQQTQWLLLPFLFAACAQANDSIVENNSNCQVSFERVDGEVEFIDAPNLDITEGEKFILPSDYSGISSILCHRSTTSIMTSDFLAVIAANKPIMIFSDDAKVVLEIVKG